MFNDDNERHVWAVNAHLIDHNGNQERVIILVYCETLELCRAHIQRYIQMNATRLDIHFLPLELDTYRRRHGAPPGLDQEITRLNVDTPVIVFHPKRYQPEAAPLMPCLIKTQLSVRKDNEQDVLLAGVPDEIASRFWQDGSKCYAVIHAVKSFWFPSDFRDEDLRSACLYEDEAAEDYESSAPYLVELPLEHDFTQKLFSENPPNSEVNFNHWGKNAGILLRSTADFEEILAHFRRFFYMPTYDGRLLYFRFFDPVVLANYLDTLTCYPNKLATFFASDLIEAYAVCDNDHFIDYVPSIDLSTQEKAKQQFDEWEMQIFIDQYDDTLLWQVSDSLVKDFPELSKLYDKEAIHKVVKSNFALAKRYQLVLTGSIYLLASYQLIFGQPINEFDEQGVFSSILSSDEGEQVKIYQLKAHMKAQAEVSNDE